MIVFFAEAKQLMGIVCCYGPYPSTCGRGCCFQGLGTVVFYQQDVLLHRVEGEFLYVDSKGREIVNV